MAKLTQQVLCLRLVVAGSLLCTGCGTRSMQRTKVEQWLREHQLPLHEKRVPEFRAAFPHARIVELERTNHAALPFQRHDRILSEMRAFLSAGIGGSR